MSATWCRGSARADSRSGKRPRGRSRTSDVRPCPPCGPRAHRTTRRSATGPRAWSRRSRARCSRRPRGSGSISSSAPLTDVVRSLGQQAGFKVVLYPENLAAVEERRRSRCDSPSRSRSGRPSTCCATPRCSSQVPVLHGIAGPREPTFALTDGTSRSVTPNFDHGPFRVSLQGIHYQRDLNYGGARGVGAAGGLRCRRAECPGPARAADLRRPRIEPGDQRTVHGPARRRGRAPPLHQPERGPPGDRGRRRPRQLADAAGGRRPAGRQPIRRLLRR